MWANKSVKNLFTDEQMQLSKHINMQPYQYLILGNQ